MILIPVKHLHGAKQRLASLLDQTTRTQLAHAMLRDVLDAVRACPGQPEVSLVTSDDFALQLAHEFNVRVIPDTANRSETDAIEMATGLCEQAGIQSTLVIPADIPLLQPAELEKVLQAAPEEGSVLVPSADGCGTNAVLRNPAALFPLRFGNDSFRPHLEAARATNKPCAVLYLPGIALDVDTPADLRELAAAAGQTRAQRLVREWNLNDFAAAANQ
jgi:2-phospho-L-lactate/phosphoenolpyruvate guanylyltransferase